MRFTDLDLDTFADATVFLDIDGTLVADKAHELPAAAAAAVKRLAQVADVYLASNGSAARTARIAEEIGVSALPKLAKPLPHKAVRSIERHARTVVIGDKFLTDGLFAIALRAEFVMVERLRGSTDSAYARIAYALDAVAWRAVAMLALMRPHQWVKNLLVFAPLFFAGGIFIPGALAATVAAFIAFSVAASTVYALNDSFDAPQDRLHPKKKFRPIASGRVSLAMAYTLVGVLLALEVVILAFYPILFPVILLYLLTNTAYTVWFKHVAVVDILFVAAFYIMRLIAGGVVTDVPLSPWIILCAFFAALFIIVGKRRAEFVHEKRRKVLDTYSKEALDFMLAGSAALAIISYGLYTVIGHPDAPLLIYTTFFVVLALFRVLNRIYTHPHQAEAPERLLFRDPWIFASFVLWGLSLFVIFYVG